MLTLIIKKMYYDQIKSGEKKFEYRAFSKRYKSLIENKKHRILRLHYLRENSLMCDIDAIDVIDCPVDVSKTICLTKYCYRIKVSNPCEIFKTGNIKIDSLRLRYFEMQEKMMIAKDIEIYNEAHKKMREISEKIIEETLKEKFA